MDQEYSYEVIGNDLQMLKCLLKPAQTVVCQASAMTYLDKNVLFEAKISDSSNVRKNIFSKLGSAISRKLSGETLFMGHLTNTGEDIAEVGVSATYPGAVIPVALGEQYEKIICQRKAFLAALGPVSIGFKMINSVSGTFFGGEGLVMQELTGNGMAFIHGGGTILTKELKNSEILVESGSLIGYTNGIEFSAVPVGRAKEMIFGGEGIFLSKLSGTGRVWIQSIPLDTQLKEVVDFFNKNPSKLPGYKK